MTVANDERMRETEAEPRADQNLSRLSGHLREQAQAVFDLHHKGARSQPRGHEVVVADLPNGFDSILRVAWSSYGPQITLTVRGWLQSPDGNLVPMRGFGLMLNLREVPGFAAAIAAALDRLESVPGGTIRLRNPGPAPHAGGGGAPKPTAPPDCTDGRANGTNRATGRRL